MKIGVLTYHFVYNFGANLQVNSTCKYLSNNGYTPIVINYVPEDLEFNYNRTNPHKQNNAFKEFVKGNLPSTEICRSDEDIANEIKKHNIQKVVIGSDAVLKAKPFLSRFHINRKGIVYNRNIRSDAKFPNPFWGSFMKYLDEPIPILLMSASSQNAQFRYIIGGKRRKYFRSLKKFSKITVRDSWTQKMVSYLSFGKFKPTITPDPVFSYNQNVKNQSSKKDILEKFELSENYLLFSIKNKQVISEKWVSEFQRIAEQLGYQCVALTMPGGVNFQHSFPKEIAPPLDPEEWYSLIKYSSGYVGENMHPIVVALHNSVPFFAFDTYGIRRFKYFTNEKSSKTYDILSLAGFLSNRISTLQGEQHYPTPKQVLGLIQNFNRDKCLEFSKKQLKKYNAMMQSLLVS